MKLKYLSEVFYEDLLENCEKNYKFYMEKQPFINNYFEGKPFFNETNILVGDINLNFQSHGKTDDCMCAISLYIALSNLTPSQASNPFLWTYLSHTEGWEYMQKRWPIDENTKSRIKNRYFVSSANSRRNVFRNGLSRLWWGVYISIDENAKDKYNLTKLLFSDEDLFVSLVERDFSMCKNVTIGILRYLLHYKEKNGNILSTEKRRELMKYINRIGGLQSLELMSIEEVYNICDNYIK